jgi:hypothetical protein
VTEAGRTRAKGVTKQALSRVLRGLCAFARVYFKGKTSCSTPGQQAVQTRFLTGFDRVCPGLTGFDRVKINVSRKGGKALPKHRALVEGSWIDSLSGSRYHHGQPRPLSCSCSSRCGAACNVSAK